MFQRILCATDFSDTAETAWEVACELARVHRGQLTLVHVFGEMPVYTYAEVPGPSLHKVWEEQRQWVEQALGERVAAATARGLAARGVVRTGSAAIEITDAASEENADLIVVGTHGRTGLNRLVIGSVAERVVRSAPAPVLTVKPRPTSQAARAA
jgi:nucleotide-binding universal stress UspA family protein